ncbi:MAG: hypothetical protein WC054_07660 [Candidatus Nanopelagicales bacterium]
MVQTRRWRGRFLAALAIGLACMALLVVVSVLAQGLDSTAQHSVLYAVAGGAVVGLIRIGSPVARYVGFLVGLILGLVYFAILAIAVPGDWIGQMVAGLVVVGVAVAISAFSGMWIQLWSVFLGTLLFIGAYQPLFDSQLWMFETQSVGTLCLTIFLSTVGFCVVIAVELVGTGKVAARVLDEPPAVSNDGTAAVSAPEAHGPSMTTVNDLMGASGTEKK